jgi:hypothetical protein
MTKQHGAGDEARLRYLRSSLLLNLSYTALTLLFFFYCHGFTLTLCLMFVVTVCLCCTDCLVALVQHACGLLFRILLSGTLSFNPGVLISILTKCLHVVGGSTDK